MYGNVLFPKQSKSKSKSKKPTRQNAVLRLMRDLKEWENCKNEFPCIEACPLSNDIMEWHCNICPDSGDFKNIIFHLIINFDKTYPTRAPLVKLCTTIPHPNVFGGWICLDMIKRYDVGKYKGWTAAYSVTSILMQLQSFLFEQKQVDQMDYDGSRTRYFDQRSFDRCYLPQIKSFKCDKCKHTWNKPFPITKTMKLRLKQCNGGRINNNSNVSEKKIDYWYDNNNNNNNDFNFWDGIYRDLEICIFSFFNVQDLLKLRRVAKRFKTLVNNTKIIQKDSIKCWFHRSTTLSNGEILCLGYGVNPTYFDHTAILENQLLFGNRKYSESVSNEIGHYIMIPSISTTFDLLSSDAFDNFSIRKTVFNDTQFTHFIPLYLNKKHGKIALKEMNKYIPKLYKIDNSNRSKRCHPWLKLLTIGNCMKSLIVSVMQDSDGKDGVISLHYSINILETFFRLHHTLLAIYFHYKNEIGFLLQSQISLFFKCDKYGKYIYRNKQNIPDLGIFLAYLTLWENKNGMKWEDICNGMLCETFTRQVKWVLNSHNHLVNSNSVTPSQRAKITWKEAKVSNRLFMFNVFFFKECCRLGEVSLEEQFAQYNENFGFPKDESLALKLQARIKKIHNNVKNYDDFFNIIGVKYPGMMKVGSWLINCMRTSSERGYHKSRYYGGYDNVAPGREIKQRQERETCAVVDFKVGIKTKVFKWGQQNKTQLKSKPQSQPKSTTGTTTTTTRRAQHPQPGVSNRVNRNTTMRQVQQQYEEQKQQEEGNNRRDMRQVVSQSARSNAYGSYGTTQITRQTVRPQQQQATQLKSKPKSKLAVTSTTKTSTTQTTQRGVSNAVNRQQQPQRQHEEEQRENRRDMRRVVTQPPLSNGGANRRARADGTTQITTETVRPRHKQVAQAQNVEINGNRGLQNETSQRSVTVSHFAPMEVPSFVQSKSTIKAGTTATTRSLQQHDEIHHQPQHRLDNVVNVNRREQSGGRRGHGQRITSSMSGIMSSNETPPTPNMQFYGNRGLRNECCQTLLSNSQRYHTSPHTINNENMRSETSGRLSNPPTQDATTLSSYQIPTHVTPPTATPPSISTAMVNSYHQIVYVSNNVQLPQMTPQRQHLMPMQTLSSNSNVMIVSSPRRATRHGHFYGHQANVTPFAPIQVTVPPVGTQSPAHVQMASYPSHVYYNYNSTNYNNNNNNNNNYYVSNYGGCEIRSNGSNVDDSERSIVSTSNSFVESEIPTITENDSYCKSKDDRITKTFKSAPHGMYNGEKPKRPPSIQNDELVESLLSQCESIQSIKKETKRGPKAVAHEMHGGAIPKRPPILMSWVTDDDNKNVFVVNNNNGGDNIYESRYNYAISGDETSENVNINENNDNNNNNIGKRNGKRHHRSKRKKTNNKF